MTMPTTPKRVALYLRVSTNNGQTTENQKRELETVAERSGWTIVQVFADNGVTGAKSRDKRPGLDAMLKARVAKFDMIAAWSVDRLGRSLQDLVQLFADLQALNIDLYLHQQHVDSSTPSGRALLQMSSVFAEFERAMVVERVHAGLARAQGARQNPRPSQSQGRNTETHQGTAQRRASAWSRSRASSVAAPPRCRRCWRHDET